MDMKTPRSDGPTRSLESNCEFGKLILLFMYGVSEVDRVE